MRKFNKPYPKAYIRHIKGEIQHLAETYDKENFCIGKYLGELVLIEHQCDVDKYLIQLDNPNYGWEHHSCYDL